MNRKFLKSSLQLFSSEYAFFIKYLYSINKNQILAIVREKQDDRRCRKKVFPLKKKDISKERTSIWNLLYFTQYQEVYEICQVSIDYQPYQLIHPLAQLDAYTVAVSHTLSNQILIICMKSYKLRVIGEKLSDQSNQNIFYFKETKLLCVTNRSLQAIHYYSIDGKLVRQFKYSPQEKQFFFMGDYKSLIIRGVYGEPQIITCFKSQEEMSMPSNTNSENKHFYSIQSVWSPRPDLIWLMEQKYRQFHIVNPCFKPSYINFYDQQHAKWFKDMPIYKNNISTIFSVEEASKSCRYFYAPDYEENVVVLPEYRRQSPFGLHLKITTAKLNYISQILLHFMLHINEDFDDDILYDSMNLLIQ